MEILLKSRELSQGELGVDNIVKLLSVIQRSINNVARNRIEQLRKASKGSQWIREWAALKVIKWSSNSTVIGLDYISIQTRLGIERDFLKRWKKAIIDITTLDALDCDDVAFEAGQEILKLRSAFRDGFEEIRVSMSDQEPAILTKKSLDFIEGNMTKLQSGMDFFEGCLYEADLKKNSARIEIDDKSFIKCYFSAKMKSQIKDAFMNRVRVWGLAQYDKDLSKPNQVEVKALEILQDVGSEVDKEELEDVNPEKDPILDLVGLGEDIWKDESADDYILKLRKEWN